MRKRSWHKGDTIHKTKKIAERRGKIFNAQSLKWKITTLKNGYRVDIYW